MEEKISLEAIAIYGDRYSEKVTKSFFSERTRITGNEILSFCDVKQVNLFIIKELFKAWKDDQKKIKSPYFDYEDEEVKQALDDLMNLLSKKISIGETHFLSLVKKAVSQTLLVIFDPYDFYSLLITGRNNRLELPSFREELKYLRINKAPLEKMLQTLEEKNTDQISGNEAFGILDQILEEVNFTPEDIDGYIEQFSRVTPLDPANFLIPKNVEPITPEPAKKYEEPVNKQNGLSDPSEPQPETKSVQQVIAPKPAVTPVSNNVPTLNEKHSREPRPTIAENFQRIAKIKESLTINQKFMFTKVLFHGDFELFSKAVDRLDQFDSLQAAMRYIEEEHASTWDRESEEFHEFMELVEKRFS